MKKFVLTIVMVVAALAAFSQQMEDVINLKSGQVVRGQILEQTPEYVRIVIIGKYKFIYPVSEIDKITKEVATTTYESRPFTANSSSLNNSSIYPEKKSASKSGYLGLIQIGAAIPISEYSLGYYKADIINGYRFSPNFSLGVGIGVRHFFDLDFYRDLGDGSDYSIYTMEEQTIFPLFLDLRTNFSKGKVSPYIGAQVGYKFPGLIANLGLGARINLGKSALHIGVGAEVMELQYYEFGYYGSSDYLDYSTAFSVNLGFSF